MNLADRNRDERIEYEEFLNFLKIIKEQQVEENSLNNKANNTKTFRPKIVLNLKTLKANLALNLKNKKTKLDNEMTKLQKDLLMNCDRFGGIEAEFAQIDKNLLFTVGIESFKLIIGKRMSQNDLDDATVGKIIEFSYEGIDRAIKSKLVAQGLVNYKHFMERLVNFKII
jgi:hypothetical protein